MAQSTPSDKPLGQQMSVSSPATNTCLVDKPWLLALILVILTFVAYQPTWHAGFIWDDDDHLTANPAMTAPHGLQMIWSSLAISRYYPLTLTNFWVQHRFWGLNPLPYHLVNIALHAINGILVFLVLRRLRIPAAWLAATMWVLHPVNVESVAWITELKNTQSGFFFFAALLCFLQFEAKGQNRWYALALLCGAGAFLSKPSTVVLPLVLLLCVWWERGSWRRKDLVRTLPFFAMALFMSALTVVEQRNNIARQGTAEWSPGVAERIVVAGKAVCFYAGKVFWPVNLTFVYPRWEVTANSIWSWLPLAGVVACIIVLWVWRQRSWARAGLFGVGFFVTALLPVLGFFDVFYFRYSFVADHFQYLASLGLIACATSGIAQFLGRNRLSSAWVVNVIYAALLLTLTGLTWEQTHIYRNPETLWRDTLTKNPQCWMAHGNLGVVLVSLDRMPEAIEHFREALRIDPNLVDTRYNLGVALEQTGQPKEAIGQYEQALRIRPNYIKAHINLGMALVRQGKIREAVEQYEQALRIQPDYPKAQNNLAWLLATRNDFVDPVRAVALAERACQLTNNRVAAYVDTLAAAYAAAGRFNDAIATAEKAVELARAAAQPQLIAKTEARLELYRAGRSYIQSASVTDPPAEASQN
jgi:tetratricopeptide (TPR) repeat protein